MTIPIFVLGIALVMMVCEGLRPGRSWPQVVGWWLRAALLNGIEVLSVYVTGLLLDPWFVAHRPWSAEVLGTTGGAIVGYLLITFVYYWWHRWRHESDFLWRWFHQIHHSPQRLEVITSFYKHPFEIFANSVITSVILYLVVGVGPAAAAGAVLLSGLAELFYHWNVKTPYWLGYIFQRPESHCVHHQEGLHAHNYADLPLWDMLFGTFRNPRQWQATCGFGPENEHRLVEMLCGVDVNRSVQTDQSKPTVTAS
jgi:sterol desaturase/sphingolipid hydroxylase (fatty acid hydroxylase superfamily)